MIKFIDPRGKVATPIEPYELSKNVRENEGEGLLHFHEHFLTVRMAQWELPPCLLDQ